MQVFIRDKITVTGIPISQCLFSESFRAIECRKEWNIDDDEKLILVLSSGLSPQKTRAMIQDLREVPGKIRFLVSAGKDAPREQQVQEFCQGDNRFSIFGFSPRIAEMMCAADILISKPGGLQFLKHFLSGLPQILFSPIPGQEEANAQYVVRHGAGACIEAKRGEFKVCSSKLLKIQTLFLNKKCGLNVSENLKLQPVIVDFIFAESLIVFHSIHCKNLILLIAISVPKYISSKSTC